MDDKINNSRKSFEELGTLYPKASNIIIEYEVIENVNCYWLYLKESKVKNRIIIYIHGGCFVLGSIKSHGGLVSHLSKELNLPVLFIEYSLAPEHPFPAAVEDIYKVYTSLLHNNQFEKIVLMGDSAGAALSLSVISKLNKNNARCPDHLVMISPWIDLSCTNKEIMENAAIDPILTKEALQNFASLYMGNNSLSVVNPIETIYGKFPPALILVGSDEILSGDSKLVYKRISEKQSVVKLSIYEKQTHVWLLDDIKTDHSKKLSGK